MEWLAKSLWALVIGAFGIGSWVATHEFRLRNVETALADSVIEAKATNSIYAADQKRLIDILGRMDERLKNIEHNGR